MGVNQGLLKTASIIKADYRILLLLGLGHLAADINQGALPILLPRLFTEYGLSYALAGAVTLAFNLSSSVIQPIFGWLSDKKTTLWILPVGVFLASLSMALLGFATEFWMVLALVLFSGIGVAAYHPQGSKAASFAGGSARATAMSVFSVGGNLGFAIGAAITAVILASGGLKGTINLLIPGVIVTFLLWTFLNKIPSKPRAENGGQKTETLVAQQGSLWLPLSFLMVIVILRSFVQAGLVTFIPLYLIHYLGAPESYGSTLVTIFLLAGAVGTIIGGPLADRFGKTRLIAWSMGLMPPLLLTFLYGPAWLSIIALVITGAVLISTFSITVVLGQVFMPNSVGMASGLMLGFAVGTGGLGAVGLGAIADGFGLNITMLTIALLPVLGLFLTFIFARIQKKIFGVVS
ncbi:MAG: MFS transporter [Bacillota bacterium]